MTSCDMRGEEEAMTRSFHLPIPMEKQICIQFAGTGATALVAPSALQVCKNAFAPGDKVKRVMLSGVEEDATVIAVEPQSDSSTHVIIRLDHGTCATYSSDIRRLRHAKSQKSASRAAETSTAADVKKPKHVDQEAVDILELKRKLDAKLYAVPVAQVNVNAHAAPGAPMFAKFAQTARQLSGTHALDVLLHGSAEHNVESILQNSLSVTHSKHGSKFWMTSDWSTANVRGPI